MAIRASHLLHLPHLQLLPPRSLDLPAEVHKREEVGGDGREKGGLNTDHLVHSSKHNRGGPTSSSSQHRDLSSFIKRTRCGIFHAQDEGPGSNSERYGGKSTSSGLQLGPETQSCKFTRDQLNTLGQCRGTGVRFVMHKVKKSHGKVCKKKKCSRVLHKGDTSEQAEEAKDKRGRIGAAFQVAASAVSLAKATDELKGNFWAASSKSSREIKRNEVLKLATLVAGGGREPLPLSQETVEGVAACLKQSGMKSGDQHLNELKLLHVEEGSDMPPWLTRSFNLCKKALGRNKGPTKKAVEAKLENVREDVWCQSGADFVGGINPAVAYAWACVWMLREIEAGACKWEHVRAEEQSRHITLSIPISKMDQAATGVRRTLQCCGEEICSRFCAWNLWMRMKNESPIKYRKKGFIFVNEKMEKLSKSKMIEVWNSATSCRVSGHSARRSGAMEHVRRGLQIQELAFLGRWRSAVVLTYANDALQEVPTNKAIIGDKAAMSWEQRKAPWTPLPSSQTPMMRAPMTPAAECFPAPAEAEVIQSLEKQGTMKQKLWVASNDNRKGKKTWHRVTKAGWQVPMADWGTACGWNFNKNPDRVSMAVTLMFNQARCRKCTDVMKIRDKVKEGHVLADFMQVESAVALTNERWVNDKTADRAASTPSKTFCSALEGGWE